MEITTLSFHNEMERIAEIVANDYKYDLGDADGTLDQMLANAESIIDEHEWVINYNKAFEMLTVCPNPDAVFDNGVIDLSKSMSFFTLITLAAYFAMTEGVYEFIVAEHEELIKKHNIQT